MVLSKEKNLELDIRKFSLANAYLHEGKAQAGAVLGKRKTSPKITYSFITAIN